MALARTYLDWNATAPLMPSAREALLRVLDMPGNASSVHKEGRALRLEVENARRAVAALLSAMPANIVFTSGATEAANLVLTPHFKMGRSPVTYSRLYVSAIEHPAVREGGRFAKADVSEIPVTRKGVVDLDALADLLAAHDMAKGLPMVAVMLANNETGIIQPIAEIAEIVAAKGGLLIVDAVQAAGRMAINIETLGADFLIISAHKLGGPKGAGALVSRGEALMPMPLIHGGGQEKGHRSGTENPAALAGFGAAALFHATDMDARNLGISALRTMFEAGLKAVAPDVIIHGEDVLRLPNTTFFSLLGMKAETGQIGFDIDGVALSAGSACSSGRVGESHVLSAMGFDAGLGALRVSLGVSTTKAEIAHALDVFAKIASRRKIAVAAA